MRDTKWYDFSFNLEVQIMGNVKIFETFADESECANPQNIVETFSFISPLDLCVEIIGRSLFMKLVCVQVIFTIFDMNVMILEAFW